jgi:uroporphyrinogen-III synthase
MSDPTMPLRVCSLESRRAEEMRSLIERHGATAFVAPSMRELPLDENPAVFSFLDELQGGRIEIVIFMTGVGARAVLDVVETKTTREAFFADLSRCTIVVRGPKPVAVLKEWGVRIDHRAPEPNTWRELLATLDADVPLAGKSIALQEYGKPNAELLRALQDRGAKVLPVPVYRWDLPADVEPLQQAVHKIIAGEFDLLLITSAQQVQHLLLVAEQLGLRAECLAAANRCLIGSIGPTATETLDDVGLHADFEPSHPKMGTLVKEALAAAPGLLAARAK